MCRLIRNDRNVMVNFKPLEYIRKMSDIDTSGFQEKNPSTPNRSYDPQLRMNDREGKKLLSKSILSFNPGHRCPQHSIRATFVTSFVVFRHP